MTGIDPLASDGDQEGNWPQPEELAGASPAPEPPLPPLPPLTPLPPLAPVAPLPPPPPEPVAVPINWLVDQGSGPIRYRAFTELAKVSPVPDRLLSLVYGHPPAITLAITQRAEGTWYNAMLAVPSPRAQGFEGIGTILAYRRLLEYGWEKDAPPLFHARRILFRLLAEDNDPTLLFELAEKGKHDDDVRRNRVLLREAAAAALAQAGYEGDPRLRGAALRLLARVMTYLRSPLAADPWTDATKRVLAPGASPPSYFFLLMLAHMPLFRLEHASEMDEILRYLTSAQQGEGSPGQRHLVMGDPLADEEGASDIAFATAWLELTARLGYLKRYDPWAQSFARLIEQCDESFVWRGKRGAGARASSPFVWPAFQLGAGTADDHASEVTFRLGLIAKFAGRPLELV